MVIYLEQYLELYIDHARIILHVNFKAQLLFTKIIYPIFSIIIEFSVVSAVIPPYFFLEFWMLCQMSKQK